MEWSGSSFKEVLAIILQARCRLRWTRVQLDTGCLLFTHTHTAYWCTYTPQKPNIKPNCLEVSDNFDIFYSLTQTRLIFSQFFFLFLFIFIACHLTFFLSRYQNEERNVCVGMCVCVNTSLVCQTLSGGVSSGWIDFSFVSHHSSVTSVISLLIFTQHNTHWLACMNTESERGSPSHSPLSVSTDWVKQEGPMYPWYLVHHWGHVHTMELFL